jgi:hypothetical protein
MQKQCQTTEFGVFSIKKKLSSLKIVKAKASIVLFF